MLQAIKSYVLLEVRRAIRHLCVPLCWQMSSVRMYIVCMHVGRPRGNLVDGVSWSCLFRQGVSCNPGWTGMLRGLCLLCWACKLVPVHRLSAGQCYPLGLVSTGMSSGFCSLRLRARLLDLTTPLQSKVPDSSPFLPTCTESAQFLSPLPFHFPSFPPVDILGLNSVPKSAKTANLGPSPSLATPCWRPPLPSLANLLAKPTLKPTSQPHHNQTRPE